MASRRVCGLMVAWVMVGAAGLLAGCGGGPGVAPSPTPSYSCTPDPGGAPCTAELAAAQAEEAKAYEEAAFVYREFTKERNRIAMAGGSRTPTPTMEKYATGQYLNEMAADLATGKKRDVRASKGLDVSNVEVVSINSELVVLRSCEDGSGIQVISSSGQVVGQGISVSMDLNIERQEDGWRITAGRESEIDQCAAR